MVGTSGFANGDSVDHIIGTGTNNLSVFKVSLDCLSSDESIQGLFHITRYPDLMEVYGWHTNGGLNWVCLRESFHEFYCYGVHIFI